MEIRLSQLQLLQCCKTFKKVFRLVTTLEKPPVLVTGGAGYFGNALVHELAQCGFTVKVFGTGFTDKNSHLEIAFIFRGLKACAELFVQNI